MKKFFDYIKSNILISTIIYGIVFCIINIVLNLLHLKFVHLIYMIAIVLFIIGVIVGIYQLLLKLKKFKVILIIIFTIILIIILPFIYIILAVRYKPMHIVEINGEKMLAQVDIAFFVEVDYYDYKIPFIINKTPRMMKSYGKGSYDPIRDNREDYLSSIYYYDKNGNRVSDFYGTPYIDLSYIKGYDSDNASSEMTIEFLETLLEKYKNNISKMDLYGDDGYIIYFSENVEEIADNDELKRVEYVIGEYIEKIRLFEEIRNESEYNIWITDYGMVSIFPVATQYPKVSNLIAMDITEDFINKPRELSGKIYYKEIDGIHFRTDDNKYYIIKNDNRINFIDNQTNEGCKFEDIKSEEYLNTTIDGEVIISHQKKLN